MPTEHDQVRADIEAELDAIAPRYDARVWTVGSAERAKNYTQRPLGFFAKTEWFALMTRAIDTMITAEGGGNVAYIMAQMFRGRSQTEDSNGAGDGFDMQNLEDAAAFAQAIAKLGSETPEFLKESFCIWLGVPRFEREWAKECMEKLPEEGGLTDDQGFEIIETFVDQNAEAMKGFFFKRIPGMVRRVADRFELNSKQENAPESEAPTPSSKPSKRTRRPTASASKSS
jgi:hypothetical protein